MALGLGSNLIIRDGGVPGVVVRLGKAFSSVEMRRDSMVLSAAAARAGFSSPRPRAMPASPGSNSCAAFPGTVGGFVRMNGGAYGREVADILVDCDVVLPGGNLVTLAGGGPALHLSPFAPARRGDRRLGPLPRRPGRSRGNRRGNGPHRRGSARNRSRSGPRPAARPSRTRRATRRGSWSTPRAAAA